ncbi:MAG: hypothetical protein AAF417_18765 [Pseudomonadota bacterium]
MSERDLGLKRFLFSLQAPEEDDSPIDRDLLNKVARGEAELTAEESHRAWRSPRFRGALLESYRDYREELAEQIESEGGMEMLPLAASEDSGHHVFDEQNFEVHIDRQNDELCPYTVSLRLKNRLQDAVAADPALFISLSDGSGFEWVCTHADEFGEINFGWYDLDSSPLERALDFGLKVALR